MANTDSPKHHKKGHHNKLSSVPSSTSSTHKPSSTTSTSSAAVTSIVPSGESANQCCDEECCVSLTYSGSIQKEEDLLPELHSGSYFCENMNITTEGDCDIDFIVLPLSTHCDLQRTIYSMQGAALENGDITPTDAEAFYLSPDDPSNPLNGAHALQFPVAGNQQIALCTLFDWGHIVDNIESNEVRIGYMGTSAGFSCRNDTVRDLCSVRTNDAPLNNLNAMSNTEYQFNDIYIIVMILSSMLIFLAAAHNVCICRKWKKHIDIEQIHLQQIDEETDGDTDASDDTEEEDEDLYTFL